MAPNKRVNPDTGVFEEQDMVGGWHTEYEDSSALLKTSHRLNQETGDVEAKTGLGPWMKKT